MPNRTLTDSSATHVLNMPIERIDLADWLLHLPTAEYQRCCPGVHIAAGATTAGDGRPMSVDVELIGDLLMIHQYVGDVAERHFCRMVSAASPTFTPDGRTTLRAIWTLGVTPLGDARSELTNRVKVVATDDFLAYADAQAIPFPQLRAALDEALAAHARRETPLFAESVERYALRDCIPPPAAWRIG
jgi:hypothetical protein